MIINNPQLGYKDPIRILHIVNSLSVSSGVMGVIMNYYQHINREKYQFDFLYFDESQDSYINHISTLGGNVYKVPRPSIKNIYKFVKTTNEFFTNSKNIFHAIHVHEILIGFMCLPLAKYYGIEKRIVHSHSTMYSNKKLKALRNYILCLPLKSQSNLYLACSEKAGEFLFGKNKVNNGKVIILNNAVNFKKYEYNKDIRNEVRVDLGIEHNFVVGHVGRFSKEKNHVFLLKVFSEIKKKIPESILLLVGNGPLRNEIELLIDELQLTESVKILGTRNDVNRIMQGMDVFILPSLFEGLGMVLIEAQASGLPCLVSDVVPSEVKITPFLVHLKLSNESDEWVENAINIFKHPNDRTFEQNSITNKYNIQKEVNRLEDIYGKFNL